MNAGTEISVASTKSFTSMLIVLSLLSMWFVNNDYYNNIKKLDAIRMLPNSIRQHLYDITFMNKIYVLKDFIINNSITSIFILGKDILYPIACEGALKIKEVCYIHCESFSASSLKHGPVALLDENFPTIIINCVEEYNSKTLNCFEEVHARKSPIILITNNNNFNTSR
jgi:glucosamine--fructose-6-phosphate aminotransferase (isomerizing)